MSHSVNDDSAPERKSVLVQNTNVSVMSGEFKRLDSPVIDTRYYHEPRLYVTFDGVDVDDDGAVIGDCTIMCYHSDNEDVLHSNRMPRRQYRVTVNENYVLDLPPDCKRFVRWRIFRRTENTITIVLDAKVPQQTTGYGMDEW